MVRSRLRQQPQPQQQAAGRRSLGFALVLQLHVLMAGLSMANALSQPSQQPYSGCPAPMRLQQLLQAEMNGQLDPHSPILLPCCYDGLTARMVARAGFKATFMTGFGVSAVNGFPDTQLISYQEMLHAANMVAEGLCSAALEGGRECIPCIADGDTGYGNAVNVKRTLQGYARAGMAGIMIEDQVSPKRCGHVAGKSVVGFEEAVQRVKAACDAR